MCFQHYCLMMGFVKINSSSPVCLSLRVLCCPILLATGFEKSVFRVLKKKKKKIKIKKIISFFWKVENAFKSSFKWNFLEVPGASISNAENYSNIQKSSPSKNFQLTALINQKSFQLKMLHKSFWCSIFHIKK
jgi:hypothetical protein